MKVKELRQLLEKVWEYRNSLSSEADECQYEPIEEKLLEVCDIFDEAILEIETTIETELNRIESESGY